MLLSLAQAARNHRFTRKASDWAAVGIILVGLALRVGWLVKTGFTEEDAFITFHYAVQIARGAGFVYNPGQPVYGTTTPLLALLLAAGLRLGLTDMILDARALDLLAAAGTLVFTFLALRASGVSPVKRLFVLAVLALSPALWLLDTSGMETPLALCGMAAAYFAWTRRRYVLAGILCGLLLLTRIDLVLWPLLLFALTFLQKELDPLERIRGAVSVGLAASLVYLPWLVFATLYFGSPIPHTIIAKIAAYLLPNRQPSLNDAGLIFGFMPLFSAGEKANGVGGVLLAITYVLAAWQAIVCARSRLLRILPLFILLEFFRLFLTQSVFFVRYFAPLLWAVLILVGLGLGAVWERGAREKILHWEYAFIFATLFPAVLWWFDDLPAAGSVLAGRYSLAMLWTFGILCAAFLLAVNFWTVKGRLPPGVFRLVYSVLLICFVGAGLRQAGVTAENYLATQAFRNSGALKSIGLWLNHNTPPGSRVMLEPLGYAGFYADRVMIDVVGLVTPAVTREKQALNQDEYSYISLFKPDYIVFHCDEALGILAQDSARGNAFGGHYTQAFRIDPLHFDDTSGRILVTFDEHLARNSCYEIWGPHTP